MSVGFLEQAARSLRAETADDSAPDACAPGDRAEQTLARVLVKVRRRARVRRVLTAVALQAGLATFGFGAWAAASGRLGVWVQEIRASVSAPAAMPTANHRPGVRRATVSPPAPAPTAAPGPVPPVERPVAVRRKPRVPAIAQAPAAAVDDENARYREAHQAHFVARDFAAAVAAWDRYLALPRPGRLALEARYNRAIALYRLGRRDEADRALRPFADGDYGPYRQAEARALLKR
jgi:hypothetical protein